MIINNENGRFLQKGFGKDRKYFKKINGEWVSIQEDAFNEATEDPFMAKEDACNEAISNKIEDDGQHTVPPKSARTHYKCDCCNYITPQKKDFIKHIETTKHKKNFTNSCRITPSSSSDDVVPEANKVLQEQQPQEVAPTKMKPQRLETSLKSDKYRDNMDFDEFIESIEITQDDLIRISDDDRIVKHKTKDPFKDKYCQKGLLDVLSKVILDKLSAIPADKRPIYVADPKADRLRFFIHNKKDVTPKTPLPKGSRWKRKEINEWVEDSRAKDNSLLQGIFYSGVDEYGRWNHDGILLKKIWAQFDVFRKLHYTSEEWDSQKNEDIQDKIIHTFSNIPVKKIIKRLANSPELKLPM